MDRWPLVGRNRELAVLAAAVRGGRGAVISGALGVGKTTLAERGVELAQARGMSVVRATATTTSRELPFGVFASVLPTDAGEDAGPGREERWDLLRRYVGVVAARDEGHGLLVSVDDAQLLDDGAATLVHQLASSAVATVVATVRSGEAVPDPVLALWKDSLCERIEVGGLPDAAIAELLEAVLGGPVDTGTVRQLVQRCRGNPLYLRELVTGALEAGALVEQSGVWRLAKDLRLPARLLDLVGHRLGGLSIPQRRVLEMLTLGEPLGEASLSELADPDAIDLLERQGLVTSRIDGRRLQVWLAHPIYGEVARAGMSALHERALARSRAEVVEATGARRREDTLSLASWRLAGGGGSASLMQAGAAAAMSRHDYSLAERLARAAIAEGAGFPPRLLAAEAAGLLGRPEQAETELAALVADASTDADKARIALLRFDNDYWVRGRRDFEPIETVATTITDPFWRGELLSRRLYVLGMTSGPAAAVEAGSVLLEDAGPGSSTGPAPRVMAYNLARMGRLDQAVRLLAPTERQGGVPGRDDPWEAEALADIGALPLTYTGRLAEAERRLAAAYVRFRDEPAVEAGAYVTLWLGIVHLEQGRVRDALQRAVESYALCEQIGRPLSARAGYIVAAQAQALAGRPEQAAETLAALDAFGLPTVLNSEADLVQARAWALVAAGRLPLARQHLKEAADLGEEVGDLIGATNALHALARLGGASQVAERLAGLAIHVDGAMTAARANYAAAVAAKDRSALEAVCDSFEGMGANLYAAEAIAETALLLRRAGDTRHAAAAEQRAARLLARCQGAVTPRVDTIASRRRLTPSEHAVAVQAAAGRSNKQMAADLHLSVRTVESHLQHVYEKLGIAGRHELAEAMRPDGDDG